MVNRIMKTDAQYDSFIKPAEGFMKPDLDKLDLVWNDISYSYGRNVGPDPRLRLVFPLVN